MIRSDEEPFHKLLKEFVRGSWLLAADSCEYCKIKYNVKIAHVNASNTDGIVEWDVHHKQDCSRRSDAEREVGLDPETRMDTVGWTFSKDPVYVCGKTFYPLASRGNIGPCLNCGLLVVAAPLILFLGGRSRAELDFCWSCAENLGLLEAHTRGKGGLNR